MTDDILGSQSDSCEIGCQVPFEKYSVREVGLWMSFMTWRAAGKGPFNSQKMRRLAVEGVTFVRTLNSSSKVG